MSTPGDLNELTEERAFQALGRALLSETVGASRLSGADAEESGRAWFGSVLPVLRQHICQNAKVQEVLMSESAMLRNAAIVATLDAALDRVFSGIPVTTISHAVIVYGIHELCQTKSK
jgi:hypothetical protein